MAFSELQKEEIYKKYHGKVLGYIRSRISSPETAEDIAADVFVKVYEKLDTYDESKAALSTWIYTIAFNKLTDYFRTRRVFEEVPETFEDSACVEEEICNAETLESLSEALSKLDERKRDIIIQRFYAGKKLKDISDMMGISYSYAKVLQKQAFDELRNNLKNISLY